ncbi:hypothetical protein P1P75_06035 [Streptomyces sp. ID05-39B]|uniref:hypothetical protein n=1 Tax=Streptomyces sp. ID05-39B TaxID=3028664 RepID=UPI0029A1F7A0|nr:hypothetical protein [Streptomyces sp. ID05-39B]MDX3526006.1 hypothetical protein [Streptomyces sp. ID05-39B]
MDAFSVVISDLTDQDPSRNVSSIKNAVIARLEASDQDVQIESTDFFNHTYAPDLVLHWRGEATSRHVYLRTSDNPEYIREDIAVVAGRNPIIMPLVPLRDSSSSSELENESANASTLVATPSSIHEFTEAGIDSPITGLLSHAVLQGGRGLLNEERARSVSSAVDAGFNAAQVSGVEETREAVVAAEELLDPARAGVLTRLLHAVWLGSGAPASAFPGATGITAELDPVSLKLLLDITVSEDPEFWRRIGSGITLEKLCELEVSRESDGLQYLIEASIDRLRAKSCRVSGIKSNDLDSLHFRWFVSTGLLGFETRNYVTHFSPASASAMDSIERPDPIPPHLGLLIHRAKTSDINLDEITIESDDGRRIDYRAPTGTAIWRDTVLEQLANVLGTKRSSAVSAVVPLPGGARHLKCDLESLTASGRTGAKFYLSEMIQFALPLLRDLSRTESDQLYSLLSNEA